MEQLKVIRTLKELRELRQYLEAFDIVAYDCETTGLHHDAEMIGYSVCSELDKAFYVVLSYWDVVQSKLVYLETKQETKDFLQYLTTKQLVAHNAVFDCERAQVNYGVNLMPSVMMDTMLAGHLLDENRSNGLKPLSVSIFGEDSDKEQKEMKDSVAKNGGQLTKDNYELYKADSELLGKYGAKDTLLTLKLFFEFTPKLFEEGLDKFFFEDETMPLLRGPVYELNTTGIAIDIAKLEKLKLSLKAENLELEAYIRQEIHPHIKDIYPGTSKAKTFNIGASGQLSWLLFIKLENYFGKLTDSGLEVCSFLGLRRPYTNAAKREFIEACTARKGQVYKMGSFNKKTKKTSNDAKIRDPWFYMQCGKETLERLALKYKWVESLLKYHRNKKLISTYIEGIEGRLHYGICKSSFLPHVVPSGRLASRNPNVQNLPRDDKRIKDCFIPRPGKVFVGADYEQIEPRTFASRSQDPRLMACFSSGDDFYSVVGADTFNKNDFTSLKKNAPDSFHTKYPKLRQMAKTIALAVTYGANAHRIAQAVLKETGIEISTEQAQEIIDNYFDSFPKVREMMIKAHTSVVKEGRVTQLFGRPRRLPLGKQIQDIYDRNMPYELKSTLNLSVNFDMQSTAASIVNRASIKLLDRIKELNLDAKLVLQCHDSLVVECDKDQAEQVAEIMKNCMEAIKLPGVKLEAQPAIGKSLAEV